MFASYADARQEFDSRLAATLESGEGVSPSVSAGSPESRLVAARLGLAPDGDEAASRLTWRTERADTDPETGHVTLRTEEHEARLDGERLVIDTLSLERPQEDARQGGLEAGPERWTGSYQQAVYAPGEAPSVQELATVSRTLSDEAGTQGRFESTDIRFNDGSASSVFEGSRLVEDSSTPGGYAVATTTVSFQTNPYGPPEFDARQTLERATDSGTEVLSEKSLTPFEASRERSAVEAAARLELPETEAASARSLDSLSPHELFEAARHAALAGEEAGFASVPTYAEGEDEAGRSIRQVRIEASTDEGDAVMRSSTILTLEADGSLHMQRTALDNTAHLADLESGAASADGPQVMRGESQASVSHLDGTREDLVTLKVTEHTYGQPDDRAYIQARIEQAPDGSYTLDIDSALREVVTEGGNMADVQLTGRQMFDSAGELVEESYRLEQTERVYEDGELTERTDSFELSREEFQAWRAQAFELQREERETARAARTEAASLESEEALER